LAAVFVLLAMKQDGPLSAIATHYAACGYGTMAIASVLVVAGLVLVPGWPLARALSWRPLVRIGKLSYGIYLWNMFVKHVYRHVTGWDTGENRWGEFVAFVALLLICEISFRFVETPLRKRWAHRRVVTEEPAGSLETTSVGV
jgi:peptidoglycan/LPS O-acetylase OafA/YrhL